MVERVGSHNKLKGLSALGASALFLASCSGSSLKPTPTNEFSPNPNKTPTPTMQVLPTETPIFTPAPEITPIPTPEPTPIVEKTPAEQAREAMLNSWLYTLNSGVQKNPEQSIQGTSYIGGNALKVKAANLNDWQDQENSILNGGQSSEVLKVSWAGGGYEHDKISKNGKASKYFGQIEINNAQVVSEGIFSLSDADTANGISWHERIKINYIERFHAKIYWMGQGNYKNLKTWATTLDNKNLPDFSDWYQTSYEGEVILQNGKWKIQLPQSSSRRSINGLIKDFTIPYSRKMELGPVCGNSCVEDYQTINIK